MATDQTSRQNQDGYTGTIIPEARGKAAAHDRWMAQGGKLGKDGTFRKGPMRGMTYDQALQKFEGMWATAPDTIKEKYAGRSKTDLAPSERPTVTGTTPTPAPKASANPPAPRVAPPAVTPPVTGTTPAPAPAATAPAVAPAPASPAPTPAMAIAPLIPGLSSAPAAQAAPQAPSGPAVTKDGMTQAQIDALDLPDSERRTGPGGKYSAADRQKAREDAAAAIQAQGGYEVNQPPPMGILEGLKADSDAIDAAGNRITKAIATDVASVIPGQTGKAIRNAAGMQKPGEPGYVAPPVAPAATPATQPGVAPTGTIGTPAPPTSGVPPMIARPPESVTGTTPAAPPVRINRLTGLPFGYLPGDSTKGLDPNAVAQSQERQKAALDAAAAAAPKAVPVQPSAREAHTAAVAAYRKDLDPAKFQAVNDAYNRGSDLEKAQMVGDTLSRTGTTPTPPGASPRTANMPPARPVIPGLSRTPRFAMARR